MIIEIIKGETLKVLTGSGSWTRLLSMTGCTGTLFTGSVDSIDLNDPFNGVVTITETFESESSSGLKFYLELSATDTNAVGTYRCHLKVLLADGKIGYIDSIIVIRVKDTV